MTVLQATDLISAAVPNDKPQTWVDFGAGYGVFTQALAQLLGPHSQVIAIDRDNGALRDLQRIATQTEHARINVVHGDVTRLQEIAELNDTNIDGALFANVLHFIADSASVLARLRNYMRPETRILVIEYDRRERSRWVPYPLPLRELAVLARALDLTDPVEIARRKSRYQGELYSAVMTWQ